MHRDLLQKGCTQRSCKRIPYSDLDTRPIIESFGSCIEISSSNLAKRSYRPCMYRDLAKRPVVVIEQISHILYRDLLQRSCTEEYPVETLWRDLAKRCSIETVYRDLTDFLCGDLFWRPCAEIFRGDLFWEPCDRAKRSLAERSLAERSLAEILRRDVL